MPNFRKLPVVVQATILDEERIIETLEGPLKGNAGDFLITGIHGEQYACKPDIFLKTYEPADEEAAKYLKDNNGLL